MPKRPKQHQIEDYSINQFRQLLPENWIIRKIDKDYGLDLEVEIVDIKNQLTANIFLVQIKATDSQQSNDIRGVSMEIETLNYYKKHQLPLMLVRYSKNTNQFFFKWVNNLDLYYAKKNAKTIKIKFDDKHLWNNLRSLIRIENDLRKFKTLKGGLVQLQIQISIFLNEDILDSENQVVSQSKLVTELSNFNEFVNIVDEEDQSLISI